MYGPLSAGKRLRHGSKLFVKPRGCAFSALGQANSTYLSPTMHFLFCKEQQHSQKQDYFVILV
jgi:hypothetical protein